MKLDGNIHTKFCEWYNVFATDTVHRQGVVALAVRDSTLWQVEDPIRYGPDVIA